MSGVVFNGLYLVQKEPSQGDKGLLVNGKYFIPVTNESSGAVASYYRCSSVDTSAKTWSGYKAVLNDGIYTFESTVTSGLTYTSVTPVVGNIYSADALAIVSSLYQGIPTDGLVFYAPLAESKATAETGQILNYTGNSIVFENYKGKNSFKLDGTASNYISASLGSLEGDFTISFFCVERERKTFAQMGYYGSYFAFYAGNIAIADSNHNMQTDKGATVDTWYFYSISRSDDTYIFYRNSDILFYGKDSGGGFSFSGDLVLGKCFSYSGGWEEFFGNITAFRIYSRALNISEIYSLANEFNVAGGQ